MFNKFFFLKVYFTVYFTSCLTYLSPLNIFKNTLFLLRKQKHYHSARCMFKQMKRIETHQRRDKIDLRSLVGHDMWDRHKSLCSTWRSEWLVRQSSRYHIGEVVGQTLEKLSRCTCQRSGGGTIEPTPGASIRPCRGNKVSLLRIKHIMSLLDICMHVYMYLIWYLYGKNTGKH